MVKLARAMSSTAPLGTSQLPGAVIARIFDLPLGGAMVDSGPSFSGRVWSPEGDASK